jgi:Tfp pilus assembly PilM family ATPase
LIALPFSKKSKGKLGIAIHDGGVTIGQCDWSQGQYIHPVVLRVEKNPRELTSSDWQTLISKASVVGTECSIALPPAFAHHQVLRLPNMSESEIKEAAAWEMADRLGVDRSALQMDAILIGSGGDVLAIAIEQSTLSCLLNPMYDAGLQPTSIEPQCVAVARTMSMLHRRQSDQAIVRSVLDFGMNDSAFMVLAGESLMFYKHLDYCGNALIESIASHTGVTIDQANRMLEETQATKKNNDISRAVRDATRAIHEAIATDAMKCIRHYGVTNRGPLSTQLIVTGSAGWNINLANVLSGACNQKVVQDVSSKHIQHLPNSIRSTKGWHISLGASLAHLSTNKQRRGSDQFARDVA